MGSSWGIIVVQLAQSLLRITSHQVSFLKCVISIFADRRSWKERPETPPKPLSTVPFRRDPDFVGRGNLLDRILEKGSASASRIALVGLGGVGWVKNLFGSSFIQY